jgi:hypothetical protein
VQNSNFKVHPNKQIGGNPVLDFVLPKDIPIDPEATLDQLTSRFRSVRDGLPELVKNSKDQYSRLGITEINERQIVVLANSARGTLAVLDFAGAPAGNFEGWTTWSDPTAGRSDLAADIEAGHGNGGKAFMVRGATSRAFLDSCFEGRRTVKGFINDEAGRRYKPGFQVVDGQILNNIAELAPEQRLDELLSDMGTSLLELPEEARQAFDRRSAYTVAYLERVLEWEGKRKEEAGRLRVAVTRGRDRQSWPNRDDHRNMPGLGDGGRQGRRIRTRRACDC